jgi:hypothetical protein
VGTGFGDVFVLRETGDEYVKKAAEGEAEQGGEDSSDELDFAVNLESRSFADD